MFAVVGDYIANTRGAKRLHWTDIFTYLYLTFGTLLMFLPVLWLVMSSFKTPAALVRFPPDLLPYDVESVRVEGYDDPLPLYDVTMEDGSVRRMAQIRRIGLEAQMIDPAAPDVEPVRVRTDQRQEVRVLRLATENYTDPLQRFNFLVYLRNSVVVTLASTLLTLVINSMAAFALAKYEFRGRQAIFVIILSTLMIPISVILVPVFLVITGIGWNNNLLGVIVPAAATPTGVFLLRQYMLTIPDELLASARIDGASEWRVYWQIVLPLAAPAMAVLAIFSVMWRWNDFLWPLIVLTRSELFTLQVGLAAFQGELNVQWHYVLAMTVLTLLPITLVFAFLQRFITTGIATTGMK
jgi:alpha-1,4-digalacturonate transport system permease protein